LEGQGAIDCLMRSTQHNKIWLMNQIRDAPI